MDKIVLESTVAQIIKKYHLCQSRGRQRAYGQNFLLDGSLLRKIAESALPIAVTDAVVEIGPGPCGLLKAIMGVAKTNKIYCIEKDVSFKPIHDNIVAHIRDRPTPHFIYEDAMDVSLQDLTSMNKLIPNQPTTGLMEWGTAHRDDGGEFDPNIVVISNLPYNVGTKLLINWLTDLTRISKMVLMFQKEVADRICAAVGTKEYGRLSIISQLLCETEKLFNVSSSAFIPKPKVTSTVVRLTPKAVTIENMAALEILTANCFRHRRKTMATIISRYYSVDAGEILSECEIDRMARPEDVSPAKFLSLTAALNHAGF